MEFCPHCEKKLTIIREKTNSTTMVKLHCLRCGYLTERPLARDTARHSKRNTQEPITVVEDLQDRLQTNPTTKSVCPKCQNTLAYFWQIQTRSADEGSTQFFRCTACHYTWRLYT